MYRKSKSRTDLVSWEESVMMGQKQTKNCDCVNNKDKEEPPSPTIVFKVHMQCHGCASKILKCLRGVQRWKTEIHTGKFTVTGNIHRDNKLADKPNKNLQLISDNKLADKPNKNLQLISPHSNKDKKPKDKQTPEKTVVLKVSRYCRCRGCFNRLRKAVLKVEGVGDDVAINSNDEWWMVTAKCTVDVNVVAGTLSKKLKRVVEVVPPKKEKEKEKEKKEKEKEKEKEGEKEGDKGGNSATAKKKKKGGGEDNGGGGAAADGKGKKDQEENLMYYGPPTRDYANGGYGHGNYIDQYNHVAQMFNEENPYACHIM